MYWWRRRLLLGRWSILTFRHVRSQKRFFGRPFHGWMGPVRPGDTLRIEGEIENLTPSKTKPQGTVVMKCTMYNQHGQAVYEFTPNTIVPRRPHN